ncbi:hypothetical protein FOZ60_002635 [Perkinsus olseni]|uniref:LITAF domain-containing protein n=1 Tax=Perkinsus olseni TaxID=32597 RepID=A0A7J6NXA7_PEROL|nr:hypothetical protein FOZ60_002635 [Perkinsus olseni]
MQSALQGGMQVTAAGTYLSSRVGAFLFHLKGHPGGGVQSGGFHLSPGQEFAALRDDEEQLGDNPTYLRRPHGSVTFGRGLTVSESPPVRYAPRRHQSGDLAARLQKTTDVTSIRFASPVATGNVTVISGGEATLDRIASGGGALTLPTSRPIAMVCPVCKCTVVTRVHYRSGACTLFAAAGLCCTYTIETAVEFLYLPLKGAGLDAGDVTIRAFSLSLGMTMAGTVVRLSGTDRGGRVYKSLALAVDAPFSMWAELMQPNGLWKWHQIIIDEGGVVILRSPKQENLVKLRITEVISKWTLPVSWRQWLVEVGRPHAVQFTVETDENYDLYWIKPGSVSLASTTSNRRRDEIPDDATGRCLLISCSTIQELDVLILAAERRVAGRKKIERILVNQPVLVLDHRRGQWEKRLVQVGVGLLSVYDYQSDGTLSEGELVKRMPLTMNLTIRSLSDLGNWACKGGLSGKVQRLSKEVEELRAELMLTRKLASTGGVDRASRALVSSSLMPVVEEDEDTLLKAVSLNFRLTNPTDQGLQTLQMAIQEGASRVVDSIKTTLSPGQEFAALRDDEEQLGGREPIKHS